MTNSQSHRKDEHVFLAEKFYQSERANDFDQLRFIHQSLPEIAFDEVSLTTKIANFTLPLPFYINAMTGGSPRTGELNRQLAQIAATLGVPIATGSQSVALRHPELMATFQILRETNPTGLIFANLGATASVDAAKQAVTMLQADALQIHLNTPQEVVMPEGDRDFHWLKQIQAIVAALDVPVIIKEVGFGMAQKTFKQLLEVGVQYIDVAGAGGTDFIAIENERRKARNMAYLRGWGQSTVESLLESQFYQSKLTILASGGVRNPLDIIKALRLGAQAVGLSGTILHLLQKNGPKTTTEILLDWKEQLTAIMAMLGAHDLTDLRQKPIIYGTKLQSYIVQRQLEVK
ncbi:type 2 isopentenyl-diphosphate Delta-isomerase [Loigolactobacillus backii]|uniref:Isopentenyl-diphosphate delta-isomerase n=1 Tax=Loigolactobacillus backii TaxID=375175 RepID=A0A192H4K3_9LACO|nr:type 2 isopentenyl-diphosphate Delta-isomerase [Loigolactobacillus backii]ANK62906.1 type 2 isopentenyl-diphosphate Delta-isomerase [Loigolactobacillus backii]ANK70086.1 type 2 isopentenyl-diphosphate Delta-isomerase [Loigolactobacillus backii]PIO83444.1 type 2 isopentenyl-diphosphate Delta-isomerase [Loigolactobacillus backii]